MASYLLGAELLPELIMGNCWLEPYNSVEIGPKYDFRKRFVT